VNPTDRENPVTDQTTSETDTPETEEPAAPWLDDADSVADVDDDAAAVEDDADDSPADDSPADDSPADDSVADDAGEGDMDRLENEGDIAADYLEEFLDIADLDGDLDMDVEGDRAAVSIVGGNVDQLVGHDGEVLEALQELTRLAVYRETGERSRLMLDVGGFRADKRTRLEKLAAEAVAEVKDSGERKALGAMSPFERKVVHDAVAAAGLSSESEGEEPRRHVVVLPS
jgi:spoIIIJ-associated protein